MTQVTRDNKSEPVRPPDSTSLPEAGHNDLIANPDYVEHVIPIITKDGRWVKWVLYVRELGWEEHSRITEKHTRVIQRGRSQETVINSTEVMIETLEKMVDGARCRPRLELGEIRRLSPKALVAFSHHFGLDEESQEGVRRDAGESSAP